MCTEGSVEVHKYWTVKSVRGKSLPECEWGACGYKE